MLLTILLGCILTFLILVLISVCTESNIFENIIDWFEDFFDTDNNYNWLNKYFKNFWK